VPTDDDGFEAIELEPADQLLHLVCPGPSARRDLHCRLTPASRRVSFASHLTSVAAQWGSTPRATVRFSVLMLLMVPGVHVITPRHASSLDACEHLTLIEAARTQQLSSLPTDALDPVGTAYRGSIIRILEEVQTARRRLEDGLYGVCTACEGDVPAEVLQVRPWTTKCTGCVRRP
jgi:hypothetical protein